MIGNVNNEGVHTHFGCNICWPSVPDLAWNARGRLKKSFDLIDESHFHIRILNCNNCTQHFISVFTETIDWIDGEDLHCWTILPLTEAETANLILKHNSLTETETEINILGVGRRSLRRDHPKAEAPHIFWSYGIGIGPHD